MKNSIIILLIVLLSNSGFSQNSKFVYNGRLTPTKKKAKLQEANFINEIMPEFGTYFGMTFNDRAKFDKRRITIYPQSDYYPQENYDYIFSYDSVEISVNSHGKVLTSQNISDALTTEQKNILNTADLGADIRIKIKFKFKNDTNEKYDSDSNISEGEYEVTVIPENEAEYPGGFKKFTEYLTENVINKIPTLASEKIQQAIVKFTVDEEGQIVDAKILKTSTDPQLDELLLDATNKMPKWTPAENSEGIKVKQEFSIPLGSSGC